MNREDIIRVMREALGPESEGLSVNEELLEEVLPFLQAVAAAEREACAKECEIVWDSRAGLETGTAFECAAAIRARGTK